MSSFILRAGLLLGSLHMLTVSSFAQTTDSLRHPSPTAYRTLVGVRAGYSQYQMSGSEVDFRTRSNSGSWGPTVAGDKNLPAKSFTAGFVVRQRLYKLIALQGEINFLRKGGQLTGQTFYDNAPIVVSYLQVPLLLHLTLAAAGPVSWHVEGGGAVNFALTSREPNPKYFAPGTRFDEPSVILSPMVGTELAWQHRNQNYFLNFRYSKDAADFSTRAYANTTYTLRHGGFTVTTGVLLGFN